MKNPQIWGVLAHADCQNEEPQMFRRFARKTLRYLADFEQIKGVLPHAGLPEWETADSADWSRLGAGYRRQDCQNDWNSLCRGKR